MTGPPPENDRQSTPTPRAAPPGGGIDPVRLYWRPGCPFCALLRRRMRTHHVACTEIDIWQDPAGAAFVRSVTGGDETVPTVAIGSRNLVNPSIGEVLDAIAAELPGRATGGEPGVGPRRSGLLRSWLRPGPLRGQPPPR
ncbi:MAG: NrdH-redoxin [Actinomycetota bacterium]|nr:NrdH-redoxin [Actinomycetota bacterium]